MKYFLLTPLNLDLSEWATSAVKGPIQVQASDETQARHAAAAQLWEPSGGQDAPWLNADLVSVVSISCIDARFPFIEAHDTHKNTGSPGTELKIFLLTPLNTTATRWELSTTKEPVCVLARNSPHARAVAAMYFDIPANKTLIFHPWWDPRLVAVTELSKPPAGMAMIKASDRPPRLDFRMRPKG